jgi:hypothetical protein
MSEHVEIRSAGERSYTVTVRDGAGKRTEHHVVVPATLATDLGIEDEERLVRVSFEFLLEREPAPSILRRFDLDVIGRYFPEYMTAIRKRLREP